MLHVYEAYNSNAGSIHKPFWVRDLTLPWRNNKCYIINNKYYIINNHLKPQTGTAHIDCQRDWRLSA